MKHNEWKTFWEAANNAYQNNGLVTYAEGDINTVKSLLRDMLLEKPNDTIEQILVLLAKTI